MKLNNNFFIINSTINCLIIGRTINNNLCTIKKAISNRIKSTHMLNNYPYIFISKTLAISTNRCLFKIMRIIKIQIEVGKQQASILLNNHTPPKNILADRKMTANNQIESNRVKKIWKNKTQGGFHHQKYRFSSLIFKTKELMEKIVIQIATKSIIATLI